MAHTFHTYPHFIYTLDLEKFKEKFSIEEISGSYVSLEGAKFPVDTCKIETTLHLINLEKHLVSNIGSEGFVTLEVIREPESVVVIEPKSVKAKTVKEAPPILNEIDESEKDFDDI
jgi:hypothetical protein